MIHNIDNLIPHKPPMRLIDEFISYGNETVHCRAYINKQHLFLNKDNLSISHWVGIEIMAQTAATYSKASTQDNNELNIAFLLSTRNYKTEIKEYKKDSILDVFAKCIILDNGTGVFGCRIEVDNKIVSTVTINAHQPQSVDSANKIIKRGS